jgi:hypothetical protein
MLHRVCKVRSYMQDIITVLHGRYLPRRGDYMHQYLARLSGSVVDIQVNYDGDY